jgi:hypothetical protein
MTKYSGLTKLSVVIGGGNSGTYTYQPPAPSTSFNDKHPWLRLGAAFVPGVSTVWDLKDMVGNFGNGNIIGGIGNLGMAIAGLVPGATALTGAARLGRAGAIARSAMAAGKAVTPAAMGVARNPYILKAHTYVNKALGRTAPSPYANYPKWLLNSAPVRAITEPRAQALEGMKKYVGWAGKPAVAVPALAAGIGAPFLENTEADTDPMPGGMKTSASAGGTGHGYGLDSSDILSLRVKMSHCDKVAHCDKMSQDSGFGTSYKAPGMVSLGDIYDAIERDRSLTYMERQQLVQAIQSATSGVSESAKVSSLMSGALGAILGQLVAKYFGGGVVGRALGAALGFGAGRSMYGVLTKKDPMPGYRVLG